ncbi:NfeD family protein [bacterium]|nr:NfeD family protein [bacterium]
MEFDTWQIYVLIAVALMISEIFVPGLILLPIGVGLLLSSAVAPFIDNQAVLYIVTAVCVGAVFLLFKKAFNRPDETPPATAVDAMIGKEVIIQEDITSSKSGYAKLYGDTWKALSADDDVSFKKDDTAIICKVEGNKIYITPKS